MVGAIFVMKIKEGHKDHLIEALKKHGRYATGNESGLRRFDLYPDPENENWIWFYEGYVDEAALNEHLQGPSHLEQWIDFGREHCIEEWPPTIMTGIAHSIWTSEDGD